MSKAIVAELNRAERRDDWLKVKLCLLRLHMVKPIGGNCPHCGALASGLGAWPETLSREQWVALVSTYISGLIYRCSVTNCGKMFVALTSR